MSYEPTLFTEALDRILGAERSREFSVTMLIGGKLRALYSETEQPCPSRLYELLRTLDEATGNTGTRQGLGKSATPTSSGITDLQRFTSGWPLPSQSSRQRQ
jgi:hypothetical protein